MQSTKPRILYVDEDAEQSFVLDSLLRHADYDPVTANFVSDALQFARCSDFDLYLLSKRFPLGSGAYLCQKLNEIAPRTPIVFLSGHSDETGQSSLIRSGSDEYVTKSNENREVLEAVRFVLSKRRPEVSVH